MKIVVLLGRVLFSLIFLFSAPGHFFAQTINYATGQGVPAPAVLVPLSGVLAALGGLSILFGYKARLGAWLIILFLVPVTLWMHTFWKITDPMMRQTDMAMFMKNVALTGGAMIIAYFGAGPVSVDEKMRRK